MTNAFEQFEKCLLFIKAHEDWFKLSDEDYERALQLYESGYIKIMKKRDSEGRRNAVLRVAVEIQQNLMAMML